MAAFSVLGVGHGDLVAPDSVITQHDKNPLRVETLPGSEARPDPEHRPAVR